MWVHSIPLLFIYKRLTNLRRYKYPDFQIWRCKCSRLYWIQNLRLVASSTNESPNHYHCSTPYHSPTSRHNNCPASTSGISGCGSQAFVLVSTCQPKCRRWSMPMGTISFPHVRFHKEPYSTLSRWKRIFSWRRNSIRGKQHPRVILPDRGWFLSRSWEQIKNLSLESTPLKTTSAAYFNSRNTPKKSILILWDCRAHCPQIYLGLQAPLLFKIPIQKDAFIQEISRGQVYSLVPISQ